jgi:hypothetical protein
MSKLTHKERFFLELINPEGTIGIGTSVGATADGLPRRGQLARFQIGRVDPEHLPLERHDVVLAEHVDGHRDLAVAIALGQTMERDAVAGALQQIERPGVELLGDLARRPGALRNPGLPECLLLGGWFEIPGHLRPPPSPTTAAWSEPARRLRTTRRTRPGSPPERPS